METRSPEIGVGQESNAAPQGFVLPSSPKTPFKDLKISGRILDDRSYAVRDGLLRIYLQLSGIPPLGWAFMFRTVWHNNASGTAAAVPQVGAEGDAIWIECIPNELSEKHLPALETAVTQANAFYRPSLQQKVATQKIRRQMDSRTRSQLNELQRSFGGTEISATQSKGRGGSLVSAFTAAWAEFKRRLRAS